MFPLVVETALEQPLVVGSAAELTVATESAEQTITPEVPIKVPIVEEAALEQNIVVESAAELTIANESAKQTITPEVAIKFPTVEETALEQSIDAESATELTFANESAKQIITPDVAIKFTIFEEFALEQAIDAESAAELTIAIESPKQTITPEVAIMFPIVVESPTVPGFAAIVPGTAATREGVCRALSLARCAGAGDPPDELAMDYLCEFIDDPHWSFAPLSAIAGTEAVRAHFSLCVDMGLEMLESACRYLKIHDSCPCSITSYCRRHGDSRRKLTDLVNQAEANMLSSMRIAPKAPVPDRRPKLKAISKRR